MEKNVGDFLIQEGYAREYDGGQRESWCPVSTIRFAMGEREEEALQPEPPILTFHFYSPGTRKKAWNCEKRHGDRNRRGSRAHSGQARSDTMSTGCYYCNKSCVLTTRFCHTSFSGVLS